MAFDTSIDNIYLDTFGHGTLIFFFFRGSVEIFKERHRWARTQQRVGFLPTKTTSRFSSPSFLPWDHRQEGA